ncbi:Holliday junction branch migration protein RuvA, partial [Candidatus Gottesmanbacteria bacterium]|nr:Holliday junction branch migration protein RuvA [Candidatus Gottesmanbacteria bacterium]
MIGMLTGTITIINSSSMVVDVHGVGYLVRVTSRLMSQLKPGTKATLFIHTHVQDDAIDLYGFSDEEELALFKL